MFASLYLMFYTTQKFRALIQAVDKVNSDVVICFVPEDSFNTQYAQIAVKPIAIAIFDEKGNREIATHKLVLQNFIGEQPIICLNPAYFALNKSKKLQAVRLQEPKVSTNGFRYSPFKEYNDLDQETIELILEDKVNE